MSVAPAPAGPAGGGVGPPVTTARAGGGTAAPDGIPRSGSAKCSWTDLYWHNTQLLGHALVLSAATSLYAFFMSLVECAAPAAPIGVRA